MSYMANPNGAEGGGYQSGPPQMRPVMGYQPQQQMGGGHTSMQFGYPSMFGGMRGNVLGPPMAPGMGMGPNPFALMQQHLMAQQAMAGAHPGAGTTLGNFNPMTPQGGLPNFAQAFQQHQGGVPVEQMRQQWQQAGIASGGPPMPHPMMGGMPGQNPFAQRLSGFFNLPQPSGMPQFHPGPGTTLNNFTPTTPGGGVPHIAMPGNQNPMAGRLGAGQPVQPRSIFG